MFIVKKDSKVLAKTKKLFKACLLAKLYNNVSIFDAFGNELVEYKNGVNTTKNRVKYMEYYATEMQEG